LVIFFFMISAAITLPKPSRLGLDPNAPTIDELLISLKDIQKYMTVLTGINFWWALEIPYSSCTWEWITLFCGGCWPGSWVYSFNRFHHCLDPPVLMA